MPLHRVPPLHLAQLHRCPLPLVLHRQLPFPPVLSPLRPALAVPRPLSLLNLRSTHLRLLHRCVLNPFPSLCHILHARQSTPKQTTTPLPTTSAPARPAPAPAPTAKSSAGKRRSALEETEDDNSPSKRHRSHHRNVPAIAQAEAIETVGVSISELSRNIAALGEQGLATPQRRKDAIRLMENDSQFSPPSRVRVAELFKVDVAAADTFSSLSDVASRTSFLERQLRRAKRRRERLRREGKLDSDSSDEGV